MAGTPFGFSAQSLGQRHLSTTSFEAAAQLKYVDTHDTQSPVPPGDVLIHNGDLSISTSFPDIQYLINWLKLLPYAHKIFIVGKHDLGLASGEKQKLNWNGLTYLQRIEYLG
jgi:predicted phosphohydrolase